MSQKTQRHGRKSEQITLSTPTFNLLPLGNNLLKVTFLQLSSGLSALTENVHRFGFSYLFGYSFHYKYSYIL